VRRSVAPRGGGRRGVARKINDGLVKGVKDVTARSLAGTRIPAGPRARGWGGVEGNYGLVSAGRFGTRNRPPTVTGKKQGARRRTDKSHSHLWICLNLLFFHLFRLSLFCRPFPVGLRGICRLK